MTDPTLLRRVALRHDPASAVEGRHAVQAALRELQVSSDLIDTAALLTSELVTNAVLHGRAALQVSAFADSALVRVEVADGSPVLPKPRRAKPDGTTGRGLQLVAALASRWGTLRLTSPDLRKIVWFELDLGDGAAAPDLAATSSSFDWEGIDPL